MSQLRLYAFGPGNDSELRTEEVGCSPSGAASFGVSACHSIVLPASEALHAALLGPGSGLLPQVLRFEVCVSGSSLIGFVADVLVGDLLPRLQHKKRSVLQTVTLLVFKTQDMAPTCKGGSSCAVLVAPFYCLMAVAVRLTCIQVPDSRWCLCGSAQCCASSVSFKRSPAGVAAETGLSAA